MLPTDLFSVRETAEHWIGGLKGFAAAKSAKTASLLGLQQSVKREGLLGRMKWDVLE